MVTIGAECQVCEAPATSLVIVPAMPPWPVDMVGEACSEHLGQVLDAARYFHPLAYVRATDCPVGL
jgi:hypothetical protein